MGNPGDGRETSRKRDRDSTGRSGRRRRRREREERGGGCVEHREQWEDPLATQTDRENELSQTNRGIGGGCLGVVPRVQSKLSRSLHARRGKKLFEDLQNLESTATKRAMIQARFRGSWEKGTMAFGECLGFSQEDTIEGSSVEVDLRKKPGVA